MFTFLEYIGLVALVAIALGGFAAAVALALAVWFGSSGIARH